METLTLARWLALPPAEVADQVARRRLAAIVTLDGTRRWTFIRDAAALDDPRRYFAGAASGTLDLIGRFFALGVHTVIVPALYPPNFERGEGWLGAALGPDGMGRVLDEQHRAAYAAWGARARLGGTWRQAQPWAAAMLADLDGRLAAETAGERLVVWECDAGDPIAALLHAAQELGPDRAAIHARFYPDGPERAHLAVISGWLRVSGAFVPTLTDQMDIYAVTNLTLDLTDAQIRAVLYDYLFQRDVAPEDNQQYTGAMIDAYRAWYIARPGRVLGLGELGPGGIWSALGGIAVEG